MIVKRLRKTKESSEIKLKDFTDLYDVTYSTISDWKIVKDTIPLKRPIKYANKYGYSLDYLFGLTDKNIKYKPLSIDLNIVVENLRQKRKVAGLTQQYVADKINTSQASYAHYENARYLISTSFLYNLSEVYDDLSIDKMLGRKKDRKTVDLILQIF